MKMPSQEYIKLVNEFGKKVGEMRGLNPGEVQELKFKINEYVEGKAKK